MNLNVYSEISNIWIHHHFGSIRLRLRLRLQLQIANTQIYDYVFAQGPFANVHFKMCEQLRVHFFLMQMMKSLR